MKYHGGSRFGLSEEKQSYIYWLCRNVDRLSPRKAKTIHRLIEESADGCEEALEEALLTGKGLTEISMKRHISEAGLQRRCEKFYKKAEGYLL